MIEMDANYPTMSALTERERDILRLLSNGLTDSEIAEAAVLTVGTVKWYNRQIYSKLGVRNRTEAFALAQRYGLTSDAQESSRSSTPAKPRHNLSAQITSFVGRERELRELKSLLAQTRLLTLTGAPGTGKTRLAHEAGWQALTEFPDGVFFVSLAPLHDPALVVHAIAQAAGITEQGSEPLAEKLKHEFKAKTLLLILDNFEHLLPAADIVSTLLQAAPRLSILVTSREPLRLYGEHEFPVPPMELPDLKHGASLQAVETCEAVTLFAQRARAASQTFTLTDDNAASVASICVHIDGLPLAIELAAARIKFYAPATLLVRLGNRLEALGDGPRDLPARQRTLRATLAWSYDLLEPDEQVLFARLGVFTGGCTLEDAVGICGESLSGGIESLLNKSLLRQIQPAEGDPRFYMLETMREYALERLEQSGELEAMRERHARYFMAVTEQAAGYFFGAREYTWLVRLEAEHDNLRAALRWSLRADDSGETTLAFIGHLARFWEVHGHFAEGYRWLQEALSLPTAGAATLTRAHALHGIGASAYMLCDYAACETLFEEALSIYTALEHPVEEAMTYVSIAEVATEIGDYPRAMALLHQAHDTLREQDDTSASARVYTQLGFGALRSGEFAQGEAWLEEGAALYASLDDRLGGALALSGLGEIALRVGELEEATALLEQSLIWRREFGHKWGIAATLGSLAWVAMLRGQVERAIEMLGESLQIRFEVGDVGGMAWCLEKLAEIALAQEDTGRAARLFGAASALRMAVNSVVDPSDQAHYDGLVARLREMLDDDIFAAVWAEGERMGLKQVIDYAL